MDDRHLTSMLERAYPSAPVPPLERLERRANAIRRRRRTRRAASAIAAAAIVVLAGVATLPGVDHSSIETPRRPVPTTIQDVSKTHAIAVAPSARLQDRQIVRVSGQFTPPVTAQDDITLQMCRVGVTPPTAGDDCDAATRQESRMVRDSTMPLRRYPYMVRRRITLSGQPFDCAGAPGCVLYAASKDRVKGPIQSRYQDKYGVAALAFDAVAPPLPGPSVTVTSHDGLRDGDVLIVGAQHLRPFKRTFVTACVSGTDMCDEVGVNDLPVGPDGSFTVTHQPWSVFFASDGTPQDCHLVACVIRVRTDYDTVDVPISFALAGPASYPQLTLDPAGPNTDGQPVTVTVLGWPGSIGQRPGLNVDNLRVGQCGPLNGRTFCSGETRLQGPEPDGRYTATLPLARTLSAPGASPIDCTQPGTCRVALFLKTGGLGISNIAILPVDVTVT